MDTPASGVSRWLTLNGRPLAFGPEAENLDAAVQEYADNRFELRPGAPRDVAVWVDGQPLETAVYGRWLWRPGGFAGLYQVEVRVGPARYQTQVRVLPGNLSQARYEAMLRQIGHFSADLLFQLHSPARERVGPDEVERLLSPLRTYALARELMVELEAALAAIARAPHRALVSQTQPRRWHEVTTYSAALSPVPGPAMAVAVGGGPVRPWPAEWQEERHELSYDVYENRLLKHFLWRQLLPRLGNLADRADGEAALHRTDRAGKQKLSDLNEYERKKWQWPIADLTRRIDELAAVAADCRQMQRRVMAWGSRPFLSGVSADRVRFAPTQVLQKHPAYSRFYRVLLRFQRDLRLGVNVESFLTTLALRKLSELYQMWAAVSLTKLLVDVLRDNDYVARSENGFFRVDEEQFHFQVNRGADIIMDRGGRQVRIRYEPYYPPAADVDEGLVTNRNYYREPDLAVELWEGDQAQRVLLFDPKYKTDVVDQSEGGPPPAGERGPARGDVEKMSRYCSEIVWKGRGMLGRQMPRVVHCAYVLYPGERLEHDPQQEVGAIPMVPDEDERLEVARNVVEELLQAAEVI